MTAQVKGLRVLLVDDEELARNDLSWLLEQSGSVCEVMSVSSGEEALRMLGGRDDIDGLFLDVQMPGLDGVELVKIIRNFKAPPAIAFVTAFDEYAVDAFDLEVCDYLMKPVEQARLEETLRRMRDRIGQDVGGEPEEEGLLRRLSGRVGNETFSVQRDDVSVVEAAGDYVRANTPAGSYLVRESISSLTSAWSAFGFIRIHRSYLVRASAITSVRVVDGSRLVEIAGRELPVSRRYQRLLQAKLDTA